MTHTPVVTDDVRAGRPSEPADAMVAHATPPGEPGPIMRLGTGFMASKTLLSAVELGLFTALARRPMTAAELATELTLDHRAVPDFPDALVALGMLEREGDGTDARYRNTEATGAFLDQESPTYLGGILEMCNARLYRFWGDLTEGLKTGRPQNEIKSTGRSAFDELYSDPVRLEHFMAAMSGISLPALHALAEAFDFGNHRTLCDAGGATGQLSIIVAQRHRHLRCTTFDLPQVEPLARRAIDAAGLNDRVQVASGDFFSDPLPHADVLTMAHVLHNWNREGKLHLLRAAYDALPEDGALIVIEELIDDARREAADGLLFSLNMLIELGDAFGFSGADLAGWCSEAGFVETSVVPLVGPTSATIAYK